MRVPGAGGGRSLLFNTHLDVVPVEAGTEGQWTEPPFAGRISGGFVWGRGALDDKIDEVYRFYTVPASNTAVGHIILQNRRAK